MFRTFSLILGFGQKPFVKSIAACLFTLRHEMQEMMPIDTVKCYCLKQFKLRLI